MSVGRKLSLVHERSWVQSLPTLPHSADGTLPPQRISPRGRERGASDYRNNKGATPLAIASMSTVYMALCSWSNVKMFLKMMVVESHIIVVYARTVFTSVESEAQF